MDKPRGFAAARSSPRRARCWRQAGRIHFRRRAGDPGNGWSQRGFRVIADLQRRRRNRADEAVLDRRPPVVEAGARHRRSPGGSGSRRQDPFPARPRSRLNIRDFATLERRWWRCRRSVVTAQERRAAGSTINAENPRPPISGSAPARNRFTPRPSSRRNIRGVQGNADEGNRRQPLSG